jgi:hypothetical protein
MAKVFRLHDGPNGTGWFISKPLTNDDLKTIKTDSKEVATSIPSPYARIDLFKSAFRWVAENEIEGKTAYHRLVSDALDVAQLFYLSKTYSNLIEIISWNPKTRFSKLIEGGYSQKQAELAATLKLFWEQDSLSSAQKSNRILYNFENTDRIYLIISKETKQVIGGTSPASLFFAAPDVREVASHLNIRCGKDVLFDKEYFSLAKRDPSFIKLIYNYSKQPDFTRIFPEFFSYIERIRFDYLEPDLRRLVTNLGQESLSNYPVCGVLNNPQDPCEFLGITLRIQEHNVSKISETSDFAINSELSINGHRPLILPNEIFARHWIYTTEGIYWQETNRVPERNLHSQTESRLPYQQDSYFWLSIGNFLEDKIIELPYSIDESKFLTCGAKKYLLPLTATYFEYFLAESASRQLRLVELAGGGVEARLEIPVRGGEILFKKIYNNTDKVSLDVHLAILPFIRIKEFSFDYTLGISERRADSRASISIICFEKGEKHESSEPVLRSKDGIQTYYYKTTKNFDLVQLHCGLFKGAVIPIWYNPGIHDNQVHFAIDFGTTNTHIEYKYGANESVPLDCNQTISFWQPLISMRDSTILPLYFTNIDSFEKELMPLITSSNSSSKFGFPIRTAVAFNKSANFNEKLELFQHINNYFFYEQKLKPLHLEFKADIKWGNYSDTKDESLVQSYIEYLLKIVYYKTLILGENPKSATICWFYPVSMDEYEKGIFTKAWNNSYRKVFNNEPHDNVINGIPESLAPYLYYRSSIIGQSLSIDVGGGSTDIAFFDGNTSQAKIISSVKFAGNAIFGDGFPTPALRNNADFNGFVNLFGEKALNKMPQSEIKELLKYILDSSKNSSDFSSLLFSYERFSDNNFSYTNLLQTEKSIKLVILVFYAAIAYYSAILAKKESICSPKNILLSGTGAKTAWILDPSQGFKNLCNLFSFYFEKINHGDDKNMSISLSPIPKEITCKGALKVGINESVTLNKIKFWIGGKENDMWAKSIDKETECILAPKYKDIDQVAKSDITKSILDFYSILDEFVSRINLSAVFNIDPAAYELFKEMRRENIDDYLSRGLIAFNKNKENHIEESLFFYPLIGILNQLAYQLSIYKS